MIDHDPLNRPIRRRRSARKLLNSALPARIVSVDGTQQFRCEILDISDGGARLLVSLVDEIPATFFLALTLNGSAHRSCEVVRRDGKDIGVRFVAKRAAK
jgi:hypothetical protein